MWMKTHNIQNIVIILKCSNHTIFNHKYIIKILRIVKIVKFQTGFELMTFSPVAGALLYCSTLLDIRIVKENITTDYSEFNCLIKKNMTHNSSRKEKATYILKWTYLYIIMVLLNMIMFLLFCNV